MKLSSIVCALGIWGTCFGTDTGAPQNRLENITSHLNKPKKSVTHKNIMTVLEELEADQVAIQRSLDEIMQRQQIQGHDITVILDRIIKQQKM